MYVKLSVQASNLLVCVGHQFCEVTQSIHQYTVKCALVCDWSMETRKYSYECPKQTVALTALPLPGIGG